MPAVTVTVCVQHDWTSRGPSWPSSTCSTSPHTASGCGTVVLTPEAHGVNLTETMRSAGIVLEWPPDRLAYQIVLAGTPAHKGATT